MKIAINPGHTIEGKGTGAIGYLSETGENRKIGKRVIELLKEQGHTVIDCTIDKSSNDLADATNKANSNGADFFCSIHLNAGGGHGTETFVYKKGGQAEIYAKRVNDKVVASCGFRNRGVKEANFYVIKNTNMPAILVEVCFVDSLEDKDKINTEKVAVAIVEGILNKSTGNITPPTGNGESIIVGSRVKIIGTHYATGQVVGEWAKSQIHTVDRIDNDRALLKEITSWCFLKDLEVV